MHVWQTLTEGAIKNHDLRPLKKSVLQEVFAGSCGIAQCIAGYAMQDAKLVVRPFATQSLKGFFHGHAGISVQLRGRGGDAPVWLAVDPTFLQFARPVLEDEPTNPGAVLRATEQGRRLFNEIARDGYFKITPATAQLYLSSFCLGRKPFEDNHQAATFLIDPPPHPYHFCFEPGDERYSRANLARQGLLMASPRLPVL